MNFLNYLLLVVFSNLFPFLLLKLTFILEFEKIDISDESSDNDLSNTISLNRSTDCIYPSSSSNIDIPNNISPLTTNKFRNHFSTQTNTTVNNENDQRRRQQILSSKNNNIKPKRMILNNETPLLSHLFGAHKYNSDSNLNFITKN